MNRKPLIKTTSHRTNIPGVTLSGVEGSFVLKSRCFDYAQHDNSKGCDF